MPINPRSKGKRYEYHIRDIINNKFRCDKCKNIFRRTPMSGAIDGWKCDLTSTCVHSMWKDFSIECKKVEKINIWECLNQAIRQASKTPLLIFSRNQEIDYVAMKLDDFFFMIQELQEARDARN